MIATSAASSSGDGDGARPGPGAPREPVSPLSIGVLIWLASELMFFAGLFAAYFVLKAANEPGWPPPGAEIDLPLALVATVLLLTSSVTVHLAVVASRDGEDRRALALWVLTIGLGAVFLGVQLYDYSQLDFSISSHAYGSIYYLLTGFHGLHVLGGVIALSVVAWVVFSRGSRAPGHGTLQVASYYWHFVDAVWIAVLLTVFAVR